MNQFKIIQLDSKTTRVKLPVGRDTRSKEEKLLEKEETYRKIDSNITPFINKLSQIKKDDDFVYIYLSFIDFISSEDVQKCIKKISGEEYPSIKTTSEDERSILLKVKTENIDIDNYKWQRNYVQYLKVLTTEPKIFPKENFSEAYKEITKEEFKDEFTIKNVIVVLSSLNDIFARFRLLKEMNLFEELRLVSEIGVLFGVLKDPKSVLEIRNIDFVACAYLEDLENLPEEYPSTSGITEEDIKVIINHSNLKNKPGVCIVDCGVTSSFAVQEEKLPYLNENILDHGTQIASLSVCAKDLLDNKKEITQEYPLFSYKMCDGKKESIIDGIINAIKTFRNKCHLFVLSYNFYYRLPTILLHYLSKRIDHFIHQANAVVLVSTGNNWDEIIKDAIDFNYLDKNPILFPSNCKNIFSVGALLKYDSTDREIAPYTRYLPYFPDLEHRNEEYFILKPNIYVYGGGISTNQEKFYLPSISANNKLVNHYGTSFANGLLGYMFLKLMENYGSVRNSETIKALMLASGNLEILSDREEGSFKISINSLREFESDIKHILLVDEHETNLNIYRRNKTSQNSEEISFYVDSNKIEKVQVFLVHSNNYIKNPYTESLVYFNIRLYEPDAPKTYRGKYTNFGDRSKWSTFGKCTPIQIAEYSLGKRENKIQSQIGHWKLQVMPTRKNVPSYEEVTIRWGVVVKLIPRADYLGKIDEIYEEILEKSKPAEIIKQDVEIQSELIIDAESTGEVPA